MNFTRRKTIVSIIFLLILAGTAQAGEFRAAEVYDGDTIKAEGHDIEIKVRLMGIDAPETSKKKRGPGQPYSQEAKKHLAALVLNKTVDIKGYGLGRYGRILGVVFVDGINVNLSLVKAGLAEVYKGKMRKDFDVVPYLQAEQKAKALQRGMWSQGNKIISPRAWRKGKR